MNKMASITDEKKICAVCLNDILDSRFLTCSAANCKNRHYDLICCNVPEKRFYNTMTSEHKQNWICPRCKAERPTDNNTNTPVRQQDAYKKTKNGDENNYQYDENLYTADRNQAGAQNLNETLISFAKRPEDLDMSIDIQDSSNISILGNTEHTINQSRLSFSPTIRRTYGPTLEEISKLLDQKLEINKQSLLTKMEEIKSSLQSQITSALTTMRNDLTAFKNTVNVEQKKISADINRINTKIQQLETENQKLRKEIEEIKAQKPLKLNEEHNKKIVIYGLNEYYGETEEELHDRVIEAFREILNVNLIGYIESTARIGRKGNRRPLAVEILSKCMTKYLLENREYFKNTGLAISEYLNEQSIRERKKLLEILKMERKNGNHAIIRDNILYINGKKFVQKPEKEDRHEESINKNLDNTIEKLSDQENEEESSFRTKSQ
ncbi:hypothetical protein NE865_01465 [Phthorimaea operculella]|nr:hypothetical protein NE865_01465 [Phthorimaea operculella]